MVPITNASAAARCGAVIDRHVPKTGGTTVRTFLRHNAKLGSCHYAGYDVSSTWKSRVGFNHVDFREIARDLAKGMWGEHTEWPTATGAAPALLPARRSARGGAGSRRRHGLRF